jgi:membrane protease YdiL (CAAX protease family)
MNWRALIFSSADGRLRSGWRLALFFGLSFSGLVLASIVVVLFGYVPQISDPGNLLVGQLATALPMLLAVFIARRYLDRRTFASLGFGRPWLWRDLLAGFFIAGVTMGAIFLFFRLAGWLDFQGFIWLQEPVPSWLGSLLTMFAIFVVVGLWEETFFRGYLFLNLEQGLNTYWAVILSSLTFALFHYNNPAGQGFFPMVGLLLAGIFFAIAYLASGSLWLPIGLHIGWNFFEGTVFGFPVSGLQTTGVLLHTVSGPDVWTGGAFGPEAGLILVPGLLLAGFLVYAYTRARQSAGE